MNLAQKFRFTLIIFIVSFIALFAMGFLFANAQEEFTAEDAAAADARATDLAEQDENVTHEDLGVGDPNILPGNPLYALKNIGRGFQSFFTFDPGAKAELRLKFANEKIIEAKKLEESGASDERVKDAIANYEKEAGRVKIRIENLKDSDKTKEEIELVVKHAADSQIKHHKALGKFMKKRNEIAPEIEIKKAEAMKHFSESMASVVEPEILQQKFEEAMKEQKGSSFRQFKNIEMLEEVKDFVPEQARGAIQNAIEQSSKTFEEEFKKTGDEQRKIFNKYIEKIGGNEVRHLEVFDSLGAFADIEKEMFEEMEKAREKARRRVEKRMKEIGDESRKQAFVAHLEGGDLEDMRIVQELETNLDPEIITSILDIKHKVDQKVREKFENAESTGDLDSFFREMDDFHDVQMLQTLNKMKEIIPDDKKEFWQEMKKKAMTEMQGEIDQARKFDRVDDKMRMMAGFNPEDMAVLDEFEGEFGPQFDFFGDMRREQADKIQGRFENFRKFSDEARFDQEDFFEETERFRLRIEQDTRAKNDIEKYAPTIVNSFDEFEAEKKITNVSDEKLDEVVKKAEELVRELSNKLIQTDDKNPGKSAAHQLYSNASANLADIAILRSQNKLGEAFGKATSAKSLAANGLRKLENEAFKEERKEYFDERDRFREEFRDLPKEERPDPNQFLKFESQIFRSIERPKDIIFPRPADEGRAEKTRATSDNTQSDNTQSKEPIFCAQVITPARHRLTGKCVTFHNSCIPDGWERIASCEFEKEETKPIFDDFQFLKVPESERINKIESGDDSLVQPLPVEPGVKNTAIPLPTPVQEPGREEDNQFREMGEKLFETIMPMPVFEPAPKQPPEEQGTIMPAPTTISPDTTKPESETKIFDLNL